MAAPAAPAPEAEAQTAAPRPRRRYARWRSPTAVGAVVLGLVAGQAIVLALVIAAGGEGTANVVDGLALLVGDVVLLAVIVAFARRGARLAPSTLGIRRTRFWPAFGWPPRSSSARSPPRGCGR